MKLRHAFCKVLVLLKMHRRDCEHCLAYGECWGEEIRQRLADLRGPELSRGSPEPDHKGQPAA